MRIGAAASPAGLASAPETVLGVTNTAAVYMPDVRLDHLAGLPIQHCPMLNDPTPFTRNQTLCLVVECLAFVGTTPDYMNTSTQVFANDPSGPPASWTWRYAGKLADHSLATQLGTDTILQPEVSLAADGIPIGLFTPAHIDTSFQVGTVGNGCVAIELASIDPPSFSVTARATP